jgi:hypothetical protein
MIKSMQFFSALGFLCLCGISINDLFAEDLNPLAKLRAKRQADAATSAPAMPMSTSAPMTAPVASSSADVTPIAAVAAEGPEASIATATTKEVDGVNKLETVEQVTRDWSQDATERDKYTKSADEYYQKLLVLEQKSNDLFKQKEDAYENLSQELNKVYNQASGSMGRFVEVGRKIEGYVQQNMARYAD